MRSEDDGSTRREVSTANSASGCPNTFCERTLDNCGSTRYTTFIVSVTFLDMTMRLVRLFSFFLLTLLFGETFSLAAANDAVPKDVQETIDKIKALNGVCTLTPENTIKTITFTNGSELNIGMFDLFAVQTDLELLHVANYRELSDTAVAKLTNLKKLKTLNLINGGISDAAIKTIAEAFPNLTALDVSSSSRLTDAAAKDIAKLEQLERLTLIFCDFSEFGILSLAALPKLRAVDIRGNMKVGDGGLSALAMLPALRSLQHRSPSISDAGIRSLTEAKELDNLFIQDFAITGQSGESIRQMEKLTSLTIFRCENFDSEGVLALQGLKLNRLTLRGLPIDDTAMEVFNDLPTVKRLYLQELPSVTDAGLASIVSLKDLEILDIWEVPITDESMQTIAKLASLKTLMLKSTKVTDAGIETLLTMPKLESVTLTDNTAVTPAMIQKLRDANKFTVLTPAR